MLGIVDGPNITIRQTEQSQEQSRREYRSLQADRVMTIPEQNAEPADRFAEFTRFDRLDPIRKRGYTKVGIEAQ